MCNYYEEIEVSTEFCKVCGHEYPVTETYHGVCNACSIEQGDTDGDTAPEFKYNSDVSSSEERNNLARLHILLMDEVSDCEPCLRKVYELLDLIEDGAIAFMLDDVLDRINYYYLCIKQKSSSEEF